MRPREIETLTTRPSAGALARLDDAAFDAMETAYVYGDASGAAIARVSGDVAKAVARDIELAHDAADDRNRQRFGEPGDEMPMREPDWVPAADDPAEHDAGGEA